MFLFALNPQLSTFNGLKSLERPAASMPAFRQVSMRKDMTKPFSICLALGFACLTVFVGCKTNCPATASPDHQKFTYVIVHGAWGGGWDWKHVDQLLTADGNKVYRPTLTGQGEHSHLASTNIDLDTHIQDIVNVILWEDLQTWCSSATATAAWSSLAWLTACPTASNTWSISTPWCPTTANASMPSLARN